MSDPRIGVITHYYDRIEVATVQLEKGNIKRGDMIKVCDKQGKPIFEQLVESLQIEGKDVETVQKGDEAGMKIDQKVKEGYEVRKS
jgi:translation initiation factor IF-2